MSQFLPPSEDNELADLTRRNQQQRARFHKQKPKSISDVMAQLFAKRGYAARKTNEFLAEAWVKAAGQPLANFSQATKINRGQVEVVVANSLMLQEIDFERGRIIDALVSALPTAGITGLKLRVGRLRK
jgi:hypothetical protein